jgi:hypothetical protein
MEHKMNKIVEEIVYFCHNNRDYKKAVEYVEERLREIEQINRSNAEGDDEGLTETVCCGKTGANDRTNEIIPEVEEKMKEIARKQIELIEFLSENNT